MIIETTFCHFTTEDFSSQKIKLLFFSWAVLVAGLAFFVTGILLKYSVPAMSSVPLARGKFTILWRNYFFLLCNLCRFISYLINSMTSAKGNIGESRICKNFTEADHAWNISCVLVHNLGC